MRVPVSWLGEWVDLPDTVTAEHLHAALVKVGLEEEDVHGFGVEGPVVVGRVLDFVDEPQSNGKTIRWCQVDVGEDAPRGIVCGAHNFAVGDSVVVTLPGAVLPGPFPIAARKTYGHVSDGMIASVKELGLGEDHAGILVLSTLGIEAEPGTDARALLGLDDFAVEVNVTPDRGYAFSVRGIAREYSHSTGAAFRDPADALEVGGAAGFPVSIDEDAPIRGRAGCDVFVTRVVRGIDATRPTPAWMIARLKLAGIRSISLAVDVTNYVMWELGQPIHGYDLAKLTGGITVRRARDGETLTTLDDVTRTLHPEDLLITDHSGPVGLAGVMGGASTEIGATTTDVLIEAANFDPVSIARTARRHKLPSEASKRFERGVDPAVARVAAERVARLLVELGGGVIDALGSEYDVTTPAAVIELPADAATRLVGVPYTADEVAATLRQIGATVEAGEPMRVTPPSWRPDLVDVPSLVEEVARIRGYDAIPSLLPVAPPGRGLSRAQRLRRAVATQLAAGGGTEVLAYPFVSEARQRLFSGDAPSIRLANALDSEAALLRRSLLPGLIDIARRNLSRGLTDLALFEIGTVFLPESGRRYGSDTLPRGAALPEAEVLRELHDSLPAQPWHVGALFVGNAVPRGPGRAAESAGLADALAAVQQLGAAVGAALRVETGSHPALHPGRTARVLCGDVEVGVAGELLPALAADADLPRVVAIVELDLDAVIAAAPVDVVPSPISGYPAATQDLSLVVATDVPAAEVLEAVRAGAGPLLEHVHLVDDYRGTGLEPGTKSLTFALRFRAADRTLTAAEATEAKLAGVARATDLTGATLRE
ncbi:phenylalanyl-tRNA synthetase beta chain [Diaminobutyricimonas aerilata]|uniref:Phenylalanine--tRNA ligase beta subunit n=1 Tax=Diaminobutyricimonas aerilata TaxID=1162967 RepID=A0A2M9CKQ7_9MICO|nr:phenylalanine--tRNA ligase subunit beta [Diaminobutyricimonas aerilata]PJJ72481.1 phenylalanyl-tRNA synthetase beta chain [Diaminobutyricimonas aerilata]